RAFRYIFFMPRTFCRHQPISPKDIKKDAAAITNAETDHCLKGGWISVKYLNAGLCSNSKLACATSKMLFIKNPILELPNN
ncbi:MAG: hypothetical protein R3294_16540, partial [Arenibacter troitsensis]|nr:hypothetical protein [Arenibacter troitsensis]